MDLTPELKSVLEALRCLPAPAIARRVPMTNKQVNALLDGGLIEAVHGEELAKYKLTEEGVFVADHLYSLLPAAPSYDCIHAPVYVPPTDTPSRPGALDFKRIPSHGACMKEMK